MIHLFRLQRSARASVVGLALLMQACAGTGGRDAANGTAPDSTTGSTTRSSDASLPGSASRSGAGADSANAASAASTTPSPSTAPARAGTDASAHANTPPDAFDAERRKRAPADAADAEKKLSDWLADSRNYGVAPSRIAWRGRYPTTIAGYPAPTDVDVVEFQMPDGHYARGMVGPVPWAFREPLDYARVPDPDLVVAYGGWLWMGDEAERGRVQTDFTPKTAGRFRQQLEKGGLKDVKLGNQFRIRNAEVFEFKATRDGKPVEGAGDLQSSMLLDSSNPMTKLPLIFLYSGAVMRAAK